MSGIAPFLFGLVGIALFVCFRLFESTREERFLSKARDAFDRLTVRLYRTAVLGDIPRVYRVWAHHTVRGALHLAVVSLVSLLRKTERLLFRISRRMYSTGVKSNGAPRAPSPFLKTISPRHEDAASRDTSGERSENTENSLQSDQ